MSHGNNHHIKHETYLSVLHDNLAMIAVVALPIIIGVVWFLILCATWDHDPNKEKKEE